MQFFIPMRPPTVTHNAKQLHTFMRGGRPCAVLHDSPELKDARAKLRAHLAPHAPQSPLTGPVRLVVKWLFPADGRHPDGKDVATWIAELQQALGSLDPIPLEPVIRAAPPSGSFALAPGVLYDFTQADASALTFTFTAPENGKAAAYHVMFKCGSTAATVTLPAGVKTPDGYVIEAGRVYELSILEGLLTYQSWESAT